MSRDCGLPVRGRVVGCVFTSLGPSPVTTDPPPHPGRYTRSTHACVCATKRLGHCHLLFSLSCRCFLCLTFLVSVPTNYVRPKHVQGRSEEVMRLTAQRNSAKSRADSLAKDLSRVCGGGRTLDQIEIIVTK